MTALDPDVPLELLVLLQRQPGHAHGLFDVADRGRLIGPEAARLAARDAFAAAVAERDLANDRLQRAEHALRSAMYGAHLHGAEVMQLAGLAGVARGTVYAWLRQAAEPGEGA